MIGNLVSAMTVSGVIFAVVMLLGISVALYHAFKTHDDNDPH